MKISKFNREINKVIAIKFNPENNVIDYDYMSYLVSSIDYDYSKN